MDQLKTCHHPLHAQPTELHAASNSTVQSTSGHSLLHLVSCQTSLSPSPIAPVSSAKPRRERRKKKPYRLSHTSTHTPSRRLFCLALTRMVPPSLKGKKRLLPLIAAPAARSGPGPPPPLVSRASLLVVNTGLFLKATAAYD